MIQRIQSVILLISSIICIVLLRYSPVLINDDRIIFLLDLQYPSLCMLLSALLSFYAIFMYKNRIKQLLIVRITRLIVAITFFIIYFTKSENQEVYYGSFLIIIPYVFLVICSIFIKRDEKLVRSADRIR